MWWSGWPLLLSDLLALLYAYFLTLLIRFHSEWGRDLFTHLNVFLGVRDTGELGDDLALFYVAHAPRILALLAVAVLGLYAFLDLYEGWRFLRRRYVARAVVTANVAALLVFYGYFYLTHNQFHPRSFFATVLAGNALLAIAFRHGWRLLRVAAGPAHNVIMIGATREADFIEQFITVHRPHGLRIAARLGWDPEQPMERLREQLADAVRSHAAELVICAERRLKIHQIMTFLRLCGELGVESKVLSETMNVLINEARLPTDMFFEAPLIHFGCPAPEAAWHRFRRSLGRVLAAVVLVLLAPVLLLIAALIVLTSPGPVLFVQERIGLQRRPFRMYKFRTMHSGAEQLHAEMEEFNESGQVLFKMRRDPRVTPVGRFLRRFSLDELPQLLNVVRGEMTIVGPRPLPRRDFESYYEEWHYSRHEVAPGMTGLWQVSGRSDVDFHNMCILDVYYLHNQSLILDAKILLRTLGVVLFARGAY